MGKYTEFRQKLHGEKQDSDIDFEELRAYLIHIGFNERINDSHHIFYCEVIPEILILQALKSKAKTYQVKQVRNVILKHRLREIDDD